MSEQALFRSRIEDRLREIYNDRDRGGDAWVMFHRADAPAELVHILLVHPEMRGDVYFKRGHCWWKVMSDRRLQVPNDVVGFSMSNHCPVPPKRIKL